MFVGNAGADADADADGGDEMQVLMLIGRPLYFMELVMGQFSSATSVKVIFALLPVQDEFLIFQDI